MSEIDIFFFDTHEGSKTDLGIDRTCFQVEITHAHLMFEIIMYMCIVYKKRDYSIPSSFAFVSCECTWELLEEDRAFGRRGRRTE